jgi:hypothetical protein
MNPGMGRTRDGEKRRRGQKKAIFMARKCEIVTDQGIREWKVTAALKEGNEMERSKGEDERRGYYALQRNGEIVTG